MRNPNHPERKIRHAKLLTNAGFTIDKRWYQEEDKGKAPTNCSKLIYWQRGEIRVTLLDYDTISLTRLVDRIIEQVKTRTCEKAKVVF